MTTTNKSKKQLVLVLMSGFFASALVGCNGDSSGSSTPNKPQIKTLATMPNGPIKYTEHIKKMKESTTATKKKHRLNQAKNGKSLQNVGDTADDITNATNFLNIAAVAVPEIGFVTAPASFIEGIYNTDALNTQLSDITNAISNLDTAVLDLQSQLTTQQAEIQEIVSYATWLAAQQDVSAFNTQSSTVSSAWASFTGGMTGTSAETSWYPNPAAIPVGTTTTLYPDPGTFQTATGKSQGDLDILTGNIFGFTASADSGAIIPATQLGAMLALERTAFIDSQFQTLYGQNIESNVATGIAAYNQKIFNYYYNSIMALQQMYIMQKEANILTYQSGNQYDGPLAAIQPVNFVNYAESTYIGTNITPLQYLTATQEALDQWATGAANQIFLNFLPYIISDNPFATNYPYQASQQIQNEWESSGGYINQMTKTQSLVNTLGNGGMPQIQFDPYNRYSFYIEPQLGNPSEYLPKYQAMWEAAGANGSIKFTSSDMNSVFQIDQWGNMAPEVVTPGYYDGESLSMWATGMYSGPTIRTTQMNIAQKCSNNGSSIIGFNDGGSYYSGFDYAPHTYAWSCPAVNSNENYVVNSVPALHYDSTNQNSNNLVFWLMDGVTNASVFASTGSSRLGNMSVAENGRAVQNDISQWPLDQTVGTFNLQLQVNGYNFAPTFQMSFGGSQNDQVNGNFYCGSGDPLCSIDPVSGQVCVAGAVVGLNWIDNYAFRFGPYLVGTNTPQHCYNS